MSIFRRRGISRGGWSVLAMTVLAGAAAPALGTWSIVLVDTRTGEIAVGSATCLASFDLRSATPVLIPGVGAATAQSFVDSTGQNRVFIRDRLAEGVAPSEIITQLAAFDGGHQTRQYGIVDALGRAATFSGSSAGAWAGGATGTFVSTFNGEPSIIAYAVQGNVLTGQPVVTAAVQAVISTQGDLAAKMMAGMEAARLMGGDGRCSCSSSAPTACGAPPPSFAKSAHIAYMLIARAGDLEGSNGIYRAGPGANSVVAADLDGDGLPELLTSNGTGNSFSVQSNTSAAGIPFPNFGSYAMNSPTGAQGFSPRRLAVADVNGDQRLDVLAAAANSGAVAVALGLAQGGFGAASGVAVGQSPRAVVMADFDGDNAPDFATANATGNSASVRLNDGAGQFPPEADIPVGAGPLDVVVGDFVGSAALDLAVLCRGAATVDLLAGDGAGQFAAAGSVPIAANGVALAAGEFDGDGRLDMAVVTDSTRQLQVLLNKAGGWQVATQTLSALSTVADVDAGDIDGDGDTDLVVVSATRFGTLINDGQGGFTSSATYVFHNSANGGTLADLDGDGDLDLALSSSGLASTLVVQNYGPGAMEGVFNDGVGCATGEYYQNFNVAFQTAASPDPVVQLKGMFDQWRAGLAGAPDAVRSRVWPRAWVGAAPHQMRTLTIELLDWEGLAISKPIAEVRVEHAPGSAGISAIGPVVPLGGGKYSVSITAGAAVGTDLLRVYVRVDEPGAREIVLMPDAAMAVVGECYANCDFSTAPPALNVADFGCFVSRFAAGDPYANCDGSATAPALNVADFACWLGKFAAGCP